MWRWIPVFPSTFLFPVNMTALLPKLSICQPIRWFIKLLTCQIPRKLVNLSSCQPNRRHVKFVNYTNRCPVKLSSFQYVNRSNCQTVDILTLRLIKPLNYQPFDLSKCRPVSLSTNQIVWVFSSSTCLNY